MKAGYAQLGLGRGMGRDLSRHLLQEAGLHYDSENVLLDVVGKLRKRGGTRPVLGVSTGVDAQAIAFYSGTQADRTRGVAGVGGGLYDVDGTLSYSAIGSPLFYHSGGISGAVGAWRFGRPFLHQDALIFPCGVGERSHLAVWSGGTFNGRNGGFATPATAAVTAGSPAITIAAADTTTVSPGGFIVVENASAAYVGRIVSVIGTAVIVSPTPTVAVSAPTSGGGNNAMFVPLRPNGSFGGAVYGCSFQNRPVYLNTSTRLSTNSYTRHPTRLAWGVLPTETVTDGALTVSGMLPAFTGAHVLARNYIDLPINEGRGLVPVGPSTLLIFGDTATLVLTGTLASITADGQSLPVDVQPLSTTVGCMSDQSVQATPNGAVWASTDGVYAYTGTITNVMAGTLSAYWQDLVAAGLEIYGSAVLGESVYVVSTSAGAFVWDMKQGKDGWSRADLSSFAGSAVDPYDGVRTYAAAYIDPASSAAPAANRSSVFRLDPILAPAADNPTDHTGGAVEASVETGTFAAGDPTRLKRFRRVVASVDLKQPADYTGTIGLVNPNLADTLYLPNAGGEQGTTNWWYATGSTVSTISADTTRSREGRYSIRFVNNATNGGIVYALPGGASDGATIWSVEAWVYSGTAGTVTLSVGGTTATTTTTGAWTQLLVKRVPGASLAVQTTVSITHSANGATVDIDPIRCTILAPWNSTGTLLTGDSTLVADTQTAYSGDQGLKCTCTATNGMGLNYTPVYTFKSGQAYTAKIWAISLSGATDYQLCIGNGTDSATQAVTLTGAWAEYTVAWTPSADRADAVVALRRASANAGTFGASHIRILPPAPSCVVEVIPGLEAEGEAGATVYATVGTVAPSTSGPDGVAGMPAQLISRGLTTRFRQTGEAVECEFVGEHVHYDLLRPERVS